MSNNFVIVFMMNVVIVVSYNICFLALCGDKLLIVAGVPL